MRAAPLALPLLVLALVVPVAQALPAPTWTGSVGHTLAVVGEPNEGGWSIAAGALWPLDLEPLSFGISYFAEDAGQRFSRFTDVNDGEDLGTVLDQHRAAWSLSWRLDADLAERKGWRPFASSTFGYYRVVNDARGQIQSRVGSAGFSLGAGLRHALGAHGALGASVRYHRLDNDVLGRFVSAGVDWSWRGGH
jgi:hypothetical protein